MPVKKRKGAQAQALILGQEIDSPLSTDIILGRGFAKTTHPGNMRYHQVLDEFLPRYDAAASRAKRSHIVREIQAHISPWARFVKRDDSGSYVVVLDDTAIRGTIGHAIRYRKVLLEQKQMQEKGRLASFPQGSQCASGLSGAPNQNRVPKEDRKVAPVNESPQQKDIGDNIWRGHGPYQQEDLGNNILHGVQQQLNSLQGSSRAIRQNASTDDTSAEIDDMIEFAFEFLSSGDEDSVSEKLKKKRPPENNVAAKDDSDSSLFSREEINAVLSVESSNASRSESPADAALG